MRLKFLNMGLHAVRTELRYFPPNSTDLIQPCDVFVIQKILAVWSTLWETNKTDMIRRRVMWKDNYGRLVKPEKLFSLRLAAKCIREVNIQRDEDGVRYARKAMIIIGMAKNLNGVWEVVQLTPALQFIVKSTKHFSMPSERRS